MTHLELIQALGIDCRSDQYFTGAVFFDTLEKIHNAANAMRGKLGDMTGINICIHVASSFVMLGSDVNKYHRVIEDVRNRFKDVDPTIIITSVALYFILEKISNIIVKYKDNENQQKELENNYFKHFNKKIFDKYHRDASEDEKKRIIREIQNANYQIEYIHKRFDRMNWMIGIDHMSILGIQPKKINV